MDHWQLKAGKQHSISKDVTSFIKSLSLARHILGLATAMGSKCAFDPRPCSCKIAKMIIEEIRYRRPDEKFYRRQKLYITILYPKKNFVSYVVHFILNSYFLT